MKDQTGAVVPDALADLFADYSLAELVSELEGVEAMIAPQKVLDRCIRLLDHYGFILADKVKDHAFSSQAELQLTIEALKAGIPYAVCPACKGEKEKKGKRCQDCRGYGYLPEDRYRERIRSV